MIYALETYFGELDESGSSGDYAVEKTITSDSNGNPINNVLRIVNPDSVFKYWRSWPACDDGEVRPFIIANDYEGDGILAKLLGDYHPFKWFVGGILESTKDENNQKKYIYEETDPELILQIAYNNDRSGGSGHWRPRKEYAFNIIDRQPESKGEHVGQNWCAVNSHTKLLRMPSTALEQLKAVYEANGKVDEYDINYTKQGKGRNTKHYIQRAGEKLPNIVIGYLTQEEKTYQTYDLKEECKLSSAQYILKYLANTIQRVDGVLGTSYYQELQKQAEIEKAEWNAQKQDAAPVNVATTSPPPTTTPSPTVVQHTPPQQQTQPPSTEQVQQPQAIPTPQEQTPPAAPVRSRVPIASDEKTIDCPFCKKSIPESSETCPECNNKLMEPCDKCKTPFSILETTCPNPDCKAQYKVG